MVTVRHPGILLTILLLATVPVGCAGDGSKTEKADLPRDVRAGDVSPGDQVRFAELPTTTDGGPDLPGELPGTEVVDAEAATDVWQPTPCGSHADCEDGGFCVEYPPGEGNFFCAPPCVEECPGDWVCKSVYVDGPDPVSLCLPPESTLCKPCQKHTDCILAASLCITDGGAYGYCGRVCNPDASECPEGFACGLVKDQDGEPLGYQCLPAAGSCCVAGEWTSCEDDNVCTQEACSPALGCVHEPVEGPCDGDDQCLEYHCVDGECLGTPIEFDYTYDGKDDDCDGNVDEDAYKKFQLKGGTFLDGGGSGSSAALGLTGAFFLGSPYAGSSTGNGFKLVSHIIGLWATNEN